MKKLKFTEEQRAFAYQNADLSPCHSHVTNCA